jgi:hypothetical protein
MNSPKPRKPRRVKGAKIEHFSVPPTDPAFPHVVEDLLKNLSHNPKWSEQLAIPFGMLFTEPYDSKLFNLPCLMMGMIYREAPTECVEEFFTRLLAMKREHEASKAGYIHRNSCALLAWKDYVKANNRTPTKRELKKFILDDIVKYKNMPPTEDTKAWKRLWDDSGLAELR